MSYAINIKQWAYVIRILIFYCVWYPISNHTLSLTMRTWSPKSWQWSYMKLNIKIIAPTNWLVPYSVHFLLHNSTLLAKSDFCRCMRCLCFFYPLLLFPHNKFPFLVGFVCDFVACKLLWKVLNWCQFWYLMSIIVIQN